MLATHTDALPAGLLFRGTEWAEPTDESRAADRAAMAAERAQRDAAIRAASPDSMTAMERAISQMQGAARLGVISATKRRARQYIRRPSDLNALAWDLASADGAEGTQIVQRIARQDGPLLNLGAALLAFRWLRRAERNGRLEELLFGQVA